MPRKRSAKGPTKREAISDDNFRRCIVSTVEESRRKDVTLEEMLRAMRRKMKGVRH
jgi:hypothetical protein